MHRPKKIYIDTSGDKLFNGIQPMLFLGFMILFVLIASYLLVNAHSRARQDLIETLSQERLLKDANQKMVSEVAGITQSRLLALKAKERLGLSKPKDEEVLVLK